MTRTDTISYKKFAPEKLGRVLVLGFGKTGQSVARYCANLIGNRISTLFVAAGTSNNQANDVANELRNLGAQIEFDCEDIQGTYDLCIASPGIPQTSDFYRNAAACSKEVISEVEFAWRESSKSSTWIAITGTNGKTTTTALCAHILQEAGFSAQAVGNIGSVSLDAVARGKTQVYVVEVSSYQLASTRFFAPDIAILLNITPDHLSWHGTMEAYEAAKVSIFNNLPIQENSLAIVNACDSAARKVAKHFKSMNKTERGFDYIPIGGPQGIGENMHTRCGSDNAAYVDNTILRILYQGQNHCFGSIESLLIEGAHNHINCLCAAAAALALGVSDTCISHALSTFQALPHRLELCGSVDGVSCYNDSKATNVDATLVALDAFPEGSVVLLLGGTDKGTKLDYLVERAQQVAHHVVCFGAAGPRFASAFKEAGACEQLLQADNLRDALHAGLSVARPGDKVVLSPACASFDEFNSFEHRGQEFKKYVAELNKKTQ